MAQRRVRSRLAPQPPDAHKIGGVPWVFARRAAEKAEIVACTKLGTVELERPRAVTDDLLSGGPPAMSSRGAVTLADSVDRPVLSRVTAKGSRFGRPRGS